MSWAKDRRMLATPSTGVRRRKWLIAQGSALTLLCATALALLPAMLLVGQHAQAAPHTTFYGVADSAILNAAATTTTTITTTTTALPTDTANPALVATNTPIVAPTATDTPSVAPTATSTPAVAPTTTNTPAPTATATATATPIPATPTPNGACISKYPNAMDAQTCNAAILAQWPQQNGNWCGIATVALIAQYLHPGSWASQGAVYSLMNDAKYQSMWGRRRRQTAIGALPPGGHTSRRTSRKTLVRTRARSPKR